MYQGLTQISWSSVRPGAWQRFRLIVCNISVNIGHDNYSSNICLEISEAPVVCGLNKPSISAFTLSYMDLSFSN